jgi:hypothetical protein
MMKAAFELGKCWRLCVTAGLLASIVSPVWSADYAISADGNSVVRTTTSTALSSAAFDASLVTSAYPGWTVTKAAAASGGAIASTVYEAGWAGGGGGAKFEADYLQSQAVAAGKQLHYLQVISTNDPLNGAVSPYIDPQPNDDNLPFYWTTSEVATRSTSRTVHFSDFSKRDPATLASTNPITWNAQLFQVEYDGANAITVRDGVSWGWDMKPATVGNAKGVFSGPAPSCPPATCSGLGTDTVNWGIGQPGGLQFVGNDFAPVVGDVFKLGTLYYLNGATQVGSAIDGIDLDIAMSFTNVAEANFSYHSRLTIVNTPNTDDPVASADYVYFSVGGFPYSFNVFEGGLASVDVMAKLTPVLGLTPGGLGSGNADKDPDVVLDPRVSGFQVSLIGFANPSGEGFVQTVPEPGTWCLFLLGLGGGWLMRRRSRPGTAPAWAC